MFTAEKMLELFNQALVEHKIERKPEGLYDPIRYVLSLGGKRIRPVLMLMAYNLYQEDVTPIMSQALAIETYHNYTLLHDDLMDEADKRRNRPTVHKKWNANTAILSGDAMLIAAYQLMCSTQTPYLRQILDLFTRTALEICGGQQYDMEFESRMDVTEDEYIEMIRLKTAVLLACALKIGAVMGGASPEDADNLYAFGINIGLAFQLQDDLLDVYGDPATFGKNIGGDILCDKKTFLLINAFRLANTEQKGILLDWMGKEERDPAGKIRTYTAIYDTLRLKELTERKIEEYYDNATRNLEALSVSTERLTVLKEVCDHLMHRQH